MPVIKSAKKKLRKDKKRTLLNREIKNLLKTTIKSYKKSPSEANLKKVFKVVDKAAKKNIIHSNKAARIKSIFAKKISQKKSRENIKKTP